VENDLRFGDDGNMKMVGGYDLLYQRVAKILLTERGSNPYHLFYGSTADRLIGQKVSAGVISSLKESVRDALDTHISIESQQAKVQEMTAEERLLRVRSVDVSMVGDDETSYLVRVSVESFSSKVVNINVVFAVPGSIPLDGDLA
jgi:phage baseplate assembly protein W